MYEEMEASSEGNRPCATGSPNYLACQAVDIIGDDGDDGADFVCGRVDCGGCARGAYGVV